ncbi:hypothetical protein [Flammeovirga aprica]|uniref:SH3 domain-containing protein n=1 Tax=Flammeovirga aprica JL-4 TaxID=694437 RepID=A0A7X9RSG5_9BACT|nr:hypothetical protein [Flammeovirga aprica]NME67200.1 hypothetical protein [Flammeovirga aprica JL-4]
MSEDKFKKLIKTAKPNNSHLKITALDLAKSRFALDQKFSALSALNAYPKINIPPSIISVIGVPPVVQQPDGFAKMIQHIDKFNNSFNYSISALNEKMAKSITSIALPQNNFAQSIPDLAKFSSFGIPSIANLTDHLKGISVIDEHFSKFNSINNPSYLSNLSSEMNKLQEFMAKMPTINEFATVFDAFEELEIEGIEDELEVARRIEEFEGNVNAIEEGSTTNPISFPNVKWFTGLFSAAVFTEIFRVLLEQGFNLSFLLSTYLSQQTPEHTIEIIQKVENVKSEASKTNSKIDNLHKTFEKHVFNSSKDTYFTPLKIVKENAVLRKAPSKVSPKEGLALRGQSVYILFQELDYYQVCYKDMNTNKTHMGYLHINCF